jgi:hypothetical protein
MTKTTKQTTRKKRCPKGSRRDKKSGECAPYKGIQLFKELKDQTISDKPTISLESLDKGAILKVYKEGELMAQTYVDEKSLERSKKIEERGNKLILQTIKKIKKDPTLLQKDKQFLRFQKKMAQKKGGASGEATSENSIQIQVQENLMEKIQSPKIAKLQAKLATLEEELKKEVDMYYSSWSSFNGFLAIINLVGTVSGTIENNMGIGGYLQNFILDGLLTNLVFFITNITAYAFSTEDINTIQTIVTYIVFTLNASILAIILSSGYGLIPSFVQDSLWLVDFILISVKNHMISTREKSTHELHLEKEIAETKLKVLKAME